ncbi:MAG: aspartate carbamoyltransferase regulatory subunit [Candidatus Thermoplasmatota archaeon]
MPKEMKVQPIENGTVIDHIACGMALKVLKIMGLSDTKPKTTVSVLIRAPSKKTKWKDVVKVEGKELKPREVSQIALVAPHATINIIRDFEVTKKFKVELPREVKGIVRCPNATCITNQRLPSEPVEPLFTIESEEPVRLRCAYCERILEDPGQYFIE